MAKTTSHKARKDMKEKDCPECKTNGKKNCKEHAGDTVKHAGTEKAKSTHQV